MSLPKSHLFLEEDLALGQLCHVFAQASVWLAKGMDKQIATYDLFVRDMPANRNFLVAAGLEEVVTWLQNIKFTGDDIDYLMEAGFISGQFAAYLKSFSFTGTVFALPEGTVFFPYEPVIRVTAPLIEASVIETYLMSAIASNVPFASKAARLKIASQDKIRLTAGPFRAHSFESGMKACRAAYFYGIHSLGNFNVAKKYHLPMPKPPIIAQHLFIKAFPSELEAFRVITEAYPGRGGFMVDTYNFEQGIENAITVFNEQKAQGKLPSAVVIDSGDIIKRSKYAREKLDEAGFKDAKIVLGGNIDEHVVAKLVATKTPCDLAFAVTEYVTLSDSPKIEVVYKLAELKGESVLYAAKLTPGKLSYPGRKQVYRELDKNGKLVRDNIGLDDEYPNAGLLVKVVDSGRLIYDLPDIEHIRNYATRQLEILPDKLKDLKKVHEFKVAPSVKLTKLLDTVVKQHT